MSKIRDRELDAERNCKKSPLSERIIRNIFVAKTFWMKGESFVQLGIIKTRSVERNRTVRRVALGNWTVRHRMVNS